MRAHIIENGIVVNSIEVESLDFMPGLVVATEGAIGWSYDGHAFTPLSGWVDGQLRWIHAAALSGGPA